MVFLHDAGIGIEGIECTLQEEIGRVCPYNDPIIDQGTTDENGMLSLNIPPGISEVTVLCDLSETGGEHEWYRVFVTEPLTELDFEKDGGTTTCDPGPL